MHHIPASQLQDRTAAAFATAGEQPVVGPTEGTPVVGGDLADSLGSRLVVGGLLLGSLAARTLAAGRDAAGIPRCHSDDH